MNKLITLPIVVIALSLVGCGSSDSMNTAEVKSFAPPKNAPRDPKAAEGIKNFKEQFEAKHGGASNAPPQAQPPTGG